MMNKVEFVKLEFMEWTNDYTNSCQVLIFLVKILFYLDIVLSSCAHIPSTMWYNIKAVDLQIEKTNFLHWIFW